MTLDTSARSTSASPAGSESGTTSPNIIDRLSNFLAGTDSMTDLQFNANVNQLRMYTTNEIHFPSTLLQPCLNLLDTCTAALNGIHGTAQRSNAIDVAVVLLQVMDKESLQVSNQFTNITTEIIQLAFQSADNANYVAKSGIIGHAIDVKPKIVYKVMEEILPINEPTDCVSSEQCMIIMADTLNSSNDLESIQIVKIVAIYNAAIESKSHLQESMCESIAIGLGAMVRILDKHQPEFRPQQQKFSMAMIQMLSLAKDHPIIFSAMKHMLCSTVNIDHISITTVLSSIKEYPNRWDVAAAYWRLECCDAILQRSDLYQGGSKSEIDTMVVDALKRIVFIPIIDSSESKYDQLHLWKSILTLDTLGQTQPIILQHLWIQLFCNLLFPTNFTPVQDELQSEIESQLSEMLLIAVLNATQDLMQIAAIPDQIVAFALRLATGRLTQSTELQVAASELLQQSTLRISLVSTPMLSSELGYSDPENLFDVEYSSDIDGIVEHVAKAYRAALDNSQSTVDKDEDEEDDDRMVDLLFDLVSANFEGTLETIIGEDNVDTDQEQEQEPATLPPISPSLSGNLVGKQAAIARDLLDDNSDSSSSVGKRKHDHVDRNNLFDDSASDIDSGDSSGTGSGSSSDYDEYRVKRIKTDKYLEKSRARTDVYDTTEHAVAESSLMKARRLADETAEMAMKFTGPVEVRKAQLKIEQESLKMFENSRADEASGSDIDFRGVVKASCRFLKACAIEFRRHLDKEKRRAMQSENAGNESDSECDSEDSSNTEDDEDGDSDCTEFSDDFTNLDRYEYKYEELAIFQAKPQVYHQMREEADNLYSLLFDNPEELVVSNSEIDDDDTSNPDAEGDKTMVCQWIFGLPISIWNNTRVETQVMDIYSPLIARMLRILHSEYKSQTLTEDESWVKRSVFEKLAYNYNTDKVRIFLYLLENGFSFESSMERMESELGLK